jgi:hypothetical protein
MKSVIKIWKNKNQILEGIKNNIFKSEDVEIIANERWVICEGCPLLDKKGSKCLVPGTGPCCGSCGCSMGLKLRSLGSECPEGKWDAVLTHEENYLLQQNLKKEDNA